MTAVWIIFGIMLFLLLLVLMGGLLIFRAASISRRGNLLKDADMLNTQQGNMLPIPVQEGLDWVCANAPRELTMESYDGVMLRGRWVPAERPRGTILLFHGWNGWAEREFCCVFSVYQKMGLNLLFVDQRGQGKSGGVYMTFGVKESRDAAQWVRFHNEKLGDFPVILDGISMGATTVLMAMGQELASNVRGVIADCGFTSPWEIWKAVAKTSVPFSVLPLLHAARLWCILLGGYDPKKHSTLEEMGMSRLPVLFLHGKEDKFVPCAMTQEAYAAYKGPKEMILVDNAGHGMSYLVERERCQKALDSFVGGVLGT